MDAKQCRRAWLQQFLDELQGKRNDLARVSGVAGPQITQVLKPPTNQSPPRAGFFFPAPVAFRY